MSSIEPRATQIAVITHDVANIELIEEARETLSHQETKYPGVSEFAKMKATPYSSTEKAHADLFDDTDARAELRLVVLDGNARKGKAGTPGSSAAAMALLDWLTATMPDVPVIVLASARVEGLDLRQSMRTRKNILALDIANLNSNADFAKALYAALKSESLGDLRVTLRIGEYSARHSTMSGGIELKGDDYIYRNLQDIYQILDATNGLEPVINGKPNGNWQRTFRDLGSKLYDSLIENTIGKHIARHYQPEKELAPVDLRVEIDVAPNETARLYGLPFELAMPSEYHDKYLCTCIPMARRIHFVGHRKHCLVKPAGGDGHVIEDVVEDDDDEDSQSLPPRDEPVRPNRPLKLLFIDASFAGTAVVNREGFPFEAETTGPFNDLTNTPDEMNAIRRFATKNGAAPPPLESVTVVRPTRACKTAKTFQKRIERVVSSQHFDILHFAGHSVTLKNGGGTFLILPDECGVGNGVSVRVVAEWVKTAHINMVLLSSCSGSSLRTAIEIMRTNAEAVLGFRWDVNDHACVEYFERFYERYLNKKQSIPKAYCGACSEVRNSKYGLPIWASAIAVVRN